jgi:hypothetical protein
MAAVSLKDLMDPLSKIALNTNETSKKLDKVIELLGSNGAGAAGKTKEEKPKADKSTKGAVSLLSSFAEASLNLIKAVVKLKGAEKSVDLFIKLLKGSNKSLEEFKDPKKAEEVVGIIDLLGKSVLRYAAALALATPLLILALPGSVLLGLSIRLLVASAGEAAKGLNNFRAIFAIGRSVLAYAAGMALVAVLAPLVLLGATVFGLSVRLLVATAGLGEKSLGAMNAVNLLAKGSLIFAATMALVAVMSPLVLLGAGVFSLSVLMVGLALRVIGKNPKKTGEGLLLLGLGVLAFSASLALSAMILKGDIMDYLKVGLLLAGTALVFYFIGKAKGEIAWGAVVVAAMGLSLLVFNFGYIPFMETSQKLTLEDVGRQVGLLTGIGTVFALAGFASGFILLGAGAFAAAGLSLIVLTFGLKMFKAMKWNDDDSLGLTTALTGIKLAFLGSDSKEEGFFAKLGGVVTGAIDAVRMVEAAGAFAAAGLSLMFLSKGLSKYKELKWTTEDSTELTTMLGGVTSAFASAGGSPTNPGGLFGAVFGTTFTPNAVERGISSVMHAGDALTGIAKGLMSFQNLINSGVKFGSPDTNGNYEEGTLGFAVSRTLGFVNSAFAAIGNQGDKQDTGLWGALGFSENVVAKGINAVKGAGKELTDIATGLRNFQDLVESDINWDVLGASIQKSLGFVMSAFAAVGNQGDKKDNGFWGALGFNENIVAKGINAVKGAGKELTDVALGLKSFQDLIDNKVDFKKLAYGVRTSLTFVGDAFSAIGGKEVKDSAFFGLIEWDENTVNKGIKAVKGAGAVLTEIATGLTKFSELKDPSGIANNIAVLLTQIGESFSTVYNTNPQLSIQLKDFGTFINILGIRAKDNSLQKAAKDLDSMAKAINSVDIKKAQSFSDLFKYGAQLASNKNGDETIKSLVKAVEDIKKILTEQASTTATTATAEAPASITNPFSPNPVTPSFGSNSGGAAAQANDGLMQQIQATLSSINQTLSNLPSAISQIEIKVPRK